MPPLLENWVNSCANNTSDLSSPCHPSATLRCFFFLLFSFLPLFFIFVISSPLDTSRLRREQTAFFARCIEVTCKNAIRSFLVSLRRTPSYYGKIKIHVLRSTIDKVPVIGSRYSAPCSKTGNSCANYDTRDKDSQLDSIESGVEETIIVQVRRSHNALFSF